MKTDQESKPYGGVLRSKPLTKKTKNMRLRLMGELKTLHSQMRAIQAQIEHREKTIEWLESPVDYGDILEELPFPRDRKVQFFVVTNVSALHVWGRRINEDGTLGKENLLYSSYKDRAVGHYSGDNLPDPPMAAAEALMAKRRGQ